MRLQVFLSKAGICSRRAARGIIKSGRVRINDREVVKPSFKVDQEKDEVFLDAKRISPKKEIYVMLHKPNGVTSTKKDPFAKKTVIDLLPHRFHYLNPVGRLDIDTTGLILLTNDGELINKFTHPKFNVEKAYAVELDRRLMVCDKKELQLGVLLDRTYTSPCRINLRSGGKLEIVLHEGRKRQIKRMFSKIGYRVTGLKRIREGKLKLGVLPEGRWRFLTEKERSWCLSRIR